MMSHRVKKWLQLLVVGLLFVSRINAWVAVERKRHSSPLWRNEKRSVPCTSLAVSSHNNNDSFSKPPPHRPLQSAWAATTMACLGLFLGCSQPANAATTYWDTQTVGTTSERVQSNKALVDYVVGTVNTHYYDASGGIRFQPLELYRTWRHHSQHDESLATRQGTVNSIHWLLQKGVGDPYTKYLTREELRAELVYAEQGFLGLGAIVEPSGRAQFLYGPSESTPPTPTVWKKWTSSSVLKTTHSPLYLSSEQVDRLPVITAITPNSPAEHAGLTVGDKIVAVGSDSFLEKDQKALQARLGSKYHADNYFGKADLTIAKPVRASVPVSTTRQETVSEANDIILGYRSTKVRLPTTGTAPPRITTHGGDSIVQYQLLQGSIFEGDAVGYIRLTRFSKSATAGFFHAIQELEQQGASAYMIDVRNNYGGVFQEALLTASTLLRDPQAILCYTLNARGGFTPHTVADYSTNERYPGYLLSTESSKATSMQAKRHLQEEQPRSRSTHDNLVSYSEPSTKNLLLLQQLASQKDIVVLMNEGTASSAEVFSAALHDNGRVVALVGTKSFGKGLVQHTFPLPDGGGLRLTVAEYLRPSLQHVSRVGRAQFDPMTGHWVGGGIQPDVYCDSKQGIPSNVGADLCVGVALDDLEEAKSSFRESGQLAVKRVGGVDGGSAIRRAVTTGVVRDEF